VDTEVSLSTANSGLPALASAGPGIVAVTSSRKGSASVIRWASIRHSAEVQGCV